MAINIDNSNAGTLTLSPPSSGGNYTLVLPSTTGTVGQALYIDGSGNFLFGSASLVGFDVVLNNTGVNSSVNVSSLTASGGTTNQHFRIGAFDNNSSLLILRIPDGTATGGDSRGPLSLDLQLAKSSNTQVAFGTSSNLIGTYLSAAGNWSTLIGCSQSSVANSSAVAGVQKVSIAATNLSGTVPASSEVSLNASTNAFNGSQTSKGAFQFTSAGEYLGNVSQFAHVFGCKQLSTTENSQLATRRIIYGVTVGAVTTVLTADGNAINANNNLGTVNNNTCQMLEVRYVGVASTATVTTTPTDYIVGWTQIFSTKAASAATQTASSTFNGVVFQGGAGSSWSTSVAANTTLGCPTFSATGSAGLTVKWIAFVMTAEVTAQA
jgi:hypothetical protein